MQKTTIFFIAATIIVLVITGVFLGYRFVNRPDNTKEVVIETQPVTETETVETIADPEPEIKPESEIPEVIKPEETTPESDEALIVDPADPFPLAIVTEEKLLEAGFLNPQITFATFQGTIFNTIDFSKYRDDDHISYTVFETNELAVKISELVFPSEEITSELYSTIKSAVSGNIDFELNETNQYGDASFFANKISEKNSVFLVVKIGPRLYTFDYPAKNHNKIKQLIQLL